MSLRRGVMEPADLLVLLDGHGLIPHQIRADGFKPLSRDGLLALERQTNILWTRNAVMTAN